MPFRIHFFITKRNLTLSKTPKFFINVNGFKYTIYVGNLPEITGGFAPRNSIGALLNNKNAIYLSEEISAQRAADTLLHEAMHAAVFNGPEVPTIGGPDGNVYIEQEAALEAIATVMREFGVHTKMFKEAFKGESTWRKITKK